MLKDRTNVSSYLLIRFALNIKVYLYRLVQYKMINVPLKAAVHFIRLEKKVIWQKLYSFQVVLTV